MMITDEQIDALWKTWDGDKNWLRTFGYQQFARAILELAGAPVVEAAPRQRFEAWAKQSPTPYDLREHKYIANGVRTYMQDRTQWAFEAYCGALGFSSLPAAPAPGESTK